MASTQPIDRSPPPAPQSRPAAGASYIDKADSDEGWQRWREIQANFVDEPRMAVGEAHQLVSELMDQIVRSFDDERSQLEQRWQNGDDVSTDELRQCLQRYRDFFGRLLANTHIRES